MIRFIALILLMAPLALHAQGPSTRMTTRIVTFAPAGLPEGFQAFYRNAENIEPFAVAVGTFGLTTPYTGPRDLLIFSSKSDAESPAAVQTPLATVTLPEKCEVVLVLCTRSADDKVSLTAHSLDSGELKAGGYRFFNFSKSLVALTMGDQKLELPAGKQSIVSDPKWLEKPVAIHIEIATVADGKSSPFYSSVVEHYPQSRTLMFCFDGNDPSEPITFVTLDADKLPQKPASGKQPSNRRKP
jgi:hypothetical protein